MVNSPGTRTGVSKTRGSNAYFHCPDHALVDFSPITSFPFQLIVGVIYAASTAPVCVAILTRPTNLKSLTLKLQSTQLTVPLDDVTRSCGRTLASTFHAYS
ncbi:hypothetical protein BJX66DRAFT_319102 [Aspergillus keveii]|uniref:Uncharacterized protein n=1 Tax=Aspergillus keveii TaxID=714993 RepID=A0ABR4FIR4_9EURO